MVDFIAEVSSNHNRDLSRMKELINTSKKSGCSGIKFQLFKIDELFAPEILAKSGVTYTATKNRQPTVPVPHC